MTGTETRNDCAPSMPVFLRAAGGKGDQEMRTFLVAATGLPTILLTAALVVVVCFWLLCAVGAVGVDSFDTDVDLRAWHMGGVPVAVAFSVLTVLAWSLSVGAAVVVAVFGPSGPVIWLLHLIAPAGALLVAWVVTCLIVRPLHSLFPDEPALSVLSEARTGDDTGLRGAGSRDPYGGASRAAARHRAA
ncbi:hypothetical protein [Streptomyces sp. 351MFTsu5.1]|uniref:hypothetical protein n=1 Tax=Streptomyces sp. 351MFTsu5.1 TaxID=1172180 RepID=UPI0018F89D4C|nr:hypothetical protein [Streptomyces sp. 351MFTsu5.1]